MNDNANGMTIRLHLRFGGTQHFRLPGFSAAPFRVTWDGQEYALAESRTGEALPEYKPVGGPLRLEPGWRCHDPVKVKA